MNKRKNGEYYELLAAKHLSDNGAKIIMRNFRSKSGEIDIIAQDEACLCYIEVKYRSGNKYGSGEDAVGLKKQQTICRVSDFYRIKYRIPVETAQRYDVIVLTDDDDEGARIKWYKNAFSYIPGRRHF